LVTTEQKYRALYIKTCKDDSSTNGVNGTRSGLSTATLNGFLLLTATNRSTKITGNALLRFHGNNGCADVSQCYVVRTLPILFDPPSHMKRRYPEISHITHSLLAS